MLNEKRIFLLKHQRAFLKSNKMHTAIVGGYGSGKTEAGLLKLFSIMLQEAVDCAYYLPTYPLVEDVALKKIPSILQKMAISYTLKKKPYNVTLANGATVMLRSMDNPDMIAGYEVGYSVIDEIDRMSRKKAEEAFNSITARNRVKLKHQNNAVDFVCTPEGYNFLYNFFVVNASENRLLIKAKTADNPFLPEDYILRLKETYPEQHLNAYLNGEFVNLETKNVFNNFNREENYTSKIVNAYEVLHIGIDFNITKMSAVIHIFENEMLYAVDEITNAYDTVQLCELIKQKYKNHKIVVYPDASGSSRKTSSSTTDHEIIKKYGFVIRCEKTNPTIRDRITATNIGFKNSLGLKRYFINTNNCPNYTESLEQLGYKNGEPDKQSGLDHVADAGTYCAFYFFKQKQSFSIKI